MVKILILAAWVLGLVSVILTRRNEAWSDRTLYLAYGAALASMAAIWGGIIS